MVEIQPQRLAAHLLNHLRVSGIQALIAHVLVIKGRQHQHPGTTQRHRMTSESDAIRQGAGAGPGHEPLRGHPRIHQELQ